MIRTLVRCVSLAALLGGGVALVRRSFLRITVAGRSMEPTLVHGDKAMVRRVPGRRVRVGDVVVFKPPSPIEPAWTVKRVSAVSGDVLPSEYVEREWTRDETRVPSDSLLVLGDNPASSYDSRHYGYISTDTVYGVVHRTRRTRESGVDRASAQ